MKRLNVAAITAALLLAAAPALADLKPDLIECNADKAARNAAMKATVGVHGSCDPEKLAKKKKKEGKKELDKAQDKVSDKLDDTRDGYREKAHDLKND